MSRPIRLIQILLCVAFLASLAPPAMAQISVIGSPSLIFSEPSIFVRLKVAFDEVNRVYLVVWGTNHANPVFGLFLDREGRPIGSRFAVTDYSTEGFCGFPSVAWGGASGSETFIVTYSQLNGTSNPKHVRFLRYDQGTAVIWAPVYVADLYSGYNNSDLPPVWTGTHFLVTWWRDDYPVPNSYIRGISPPGIFTTGEVRLSDGADGEATPVVDCDATTGRCLAIGSAWGMPFPSPYGGAWARAFDGNTLSAFGSIFYVDGGNGGCNDTSVVFNSAENRFFAAFTRTGAGIFSRLVQPDWTMGALNHVLGYEAGQASLSYNRATGTVLLSYKDYYNALAVELDSSGYGKLPATLLNVPRSDGTSFSNDYYPVAAVNAADHEWLVGYEGDFYVSGWATRISGQSSAPPSLPLDAPSNLEAAGMGSTGITLMWTDNSTDESDFRVERSPDGSTGWTEVAVLPANVATRLDSGLNPATTYYYRLRARRASDNSYSAYSSVAAATTAASASSRLFWQHSAGQVCHWMMDGAVQAGAGPIFEGETLWEIVGNGDFDGDGSIDLVWQHPTGLVTVWFLDGTSLKGTASIYGGTTNWKVVAAGDFNYDGRPDLVWQDPAGAVIVWFMSGATCLGTAEIHDGSTDWRVVAAGDLNGDGNRDVIWQLPTGEVLVWFLSGTTYVGHSLIYAGTTDWTVVGVVDVSGDGRDDILWQHPTGPVTVWTMEGVNQVGASSIFDGTTDWRMTVR